MVITMADIELKNIRKVYPGDITAVRDFDLQIEDKEFIVLVGPSGCGKSTILRLIAGLETITEGEIFIGGKKVNNVQSKDRDIAMVFQNYALYPHMTVYKNMAFALKLRRTPRHEIDRLVIEAARILGIEPLLQRKPKALSGGERQRVALGRAMVRNPAAFLLDEPLSNLDAKLRAGMRTELIKLHQRLGTTFVYVTHDQTEAMTMGDRIVIMKDGLIQQVDTPQNVYDNPCNVFVAGFIGSPQMNFISGRLDEENGGLIITVNSDKFSLKSGKTSGKASGKTSKKASGETSDDDSNIDPAEYAGKEVIVGIRPEDLHVDEAFLNENPGSLIKATVDISEPMGSEVFLYLDYFENRLTARVPPGVVYKSGSEITLGVNTSKIHLFDAETEEAIL